MSSEDLSAVRAAILAACALVVDLTAPDPAFLELVAPGDAPERRAQIATKSDCGLVLLGIQERALEVPPRGPYREGSAFELVYERVGGNPWHPGGAMRIATLETPPLRGDGVVWGPVVGGASAHMEHVAGVELEDEGDRGTFTVIAGGERRDGKQTVKPLQRTVRWNGHVWQDTMNGRPLIGVIDADLLGNLFPVRT